MTRRQQLPAVQADLSDPGRARGHNSPFSYALLDTGRTPALENNSKSPKKTVELGPGSGWSAVVGPLRAPIAFLPLQGTGPFAPLQAAPTTDRPPAGTGVPVTTERRGEGARA